MNATALGTRPAFRHGIAVSTEARARATLGSRAGRALDDIEWVRNRSKLLDFATILRGWGSKRKNGDRLGNV
jgi:hypothetical protein